MVMQSFEFGHLVGNNASGFPATDCSFPNVVDLWVTDGVAGHVKVKMFDNFAYLVLSRTRAVSNGRKSIQQHGLCLGHF